ncbi:uncharacterized [Tachysurus ichikawai]
MNAVHYPSALLVGSSPASAAWGFKWQDIDTRHRKVTERVCAEVFVACGGWGFEVEGKNVLNLRNGQRERPLSTLPHGALRKGNGGRRRRLRDREDQHLDKETGEQNTAHRSERLC